MVHCFQNIWFYKRMHPNMHRNGYWLSTKWVLASGDHLSSRDLCSQSRSCHLQQGCVPEGALH